MQRGFAAIPNHVIRDATIPASARLLYGIILSYAFAGRRCTASTARLCEEAGIERATFWRAIHVLVERRLLSVEKHKTPNGWRNSYAPIIKALDISEDAPEDATEDSLNMRQPPGGSSHQRDGGSSHQPDDPPGDTYTRARVPSAVEEDQTEEDNCKERSSGRGRDALSACDSPPSWSFSGRTVPPEKRRVVLEVLAVFNERAGTDFGAFGARGPSENLKRITGAVLDHPDASVADWRGLIDWTLAHPWWPDGAPTIGVVFGPKVLDANIERCRLRVDPSKRNVRGNGDLIRELLVAGGEL